MVARACPHLIRLLALAWLGAGSPGCATPPQGMANNQRCVLTAWYRPDLALADPTLKLTPEQAGQPELLGSWNGWQRPGLRAWEDRRADDTGTGPDWRVVSLPLQTGLYHYGVLVGPDLLLDDQNPQSDFAPNPLVAGSDPLGTEVSRVLIPDCSQPVLQVSQATATPLGDLTVSAAFTPGDAGDPLDPSSARVELRRGPAPLPPPPLSADGDHSTLSAHLTGLPPGKYTITIHAADTAGRPTPPIAASVFVEPDPGPPALGNDLRPRPLADGLIYHLMIDRFRGPGPLRPPPSPGDRAGGTLGGVQAAIEAGYFDRLGVTTLWLSPVYQNPPGRWVGRDGHLYQAYHGYWPAAPRTVEPLFGGEAALDALIASAHARGLRVILDAVPNHVHSSHPYYQQHSRLRPEIATAPDPRLASWFNDGPNACVCGTPGCDWGTRMEDCWFDTYLPDVNQRQPDALKAEADDLLWWSSRFDLDGLRIDAVPMMPRSATRRIARTQRDATQRAGLDGLLLGENYTGPGEDGRELLRAYLGLRYDGLDSEFDFPLMWATRDILGDGQRGLDGLEQEIAASDKDFAGTGAVIAHILDNHDTPRFLSEAAGDAGNDPWASPPPQPTTPEPYARQALALTLLLTLPGLPVLYYGDEVALAGAGDPDSRRVLPDVLGGSLPSLQARTLDLVQRLGQLRRCLPALRRGVRTVLLADTDHSVALHRMPSGSPDGGVAVVVLSRDRNPAALAVSGLPPGHYHDVLSSAQFNAPDGSGEILSPPLSPSVYVPDTTRGCP